MIWINLVKKTKVSYYKKMPNQNNMNPKGTWNIINKLINKKSRTTTVNELMVNDK